MSRTRLASPVLAALATFTLTHRAGAQTDAGNSPAPAAAEEPFVAPPVDDNAALQYWQAFVVMPTFDEEQQKLLEHSADVPIDDSVRKLLGQAQTSLMFMHRGAKLPRCNWGLDYADGLQLHLPQLLGARTLSRVAALDIRRAFEEHQFDVARDDAIDAIILGRRVGRDPMLVSLLVSYRIDEIVVDAVAPYLPELHRPTPTP